MDDVVEKIAEAVLADLEDRKGIKQELTGIRYGDPEIYAEIKEAIGTNAIVALEAAGWVAVPVEPTEEMHAVGVHRREDSCNTREIYKAMVAARPRLIGKGE